MSSCQSMSNPEEYPLPSWQTCFDQLPIELVEIIFEFLDDQSRMHSERVCSKFHRACNQVEIRELRAWWRIVNSCLKLPLVEEPAFTDDEMLENYFQNNVSKYHNILKKFQPQNLPNLAFHVREFLKFNNGKIHSSSRSMFFHPSQILLPFSQWTIDFFEPMQQVCWVVGFLRGRRVFLDGPMVYVENQGMFVHFKYWVVKYKDEKYKQDSHNLELIKLMTRDSSLPRFLSEDQFMHNGSCLKYAPKEMLLKGNYITRLMKRHPSLFIYVNSHFNNDREIVKIVLEHCPKYLEFVSNELRDDKELVKLAVSKKGNMLGYASQRLRDDYEVAWTAVNNDGAALESCSARLCALRELVLMSVKSHGECLKIVKDQFGDDYEIVFEAVRNAPHALQYVSESIIERHREIVNIAISQDSNSFNWLINAIGHNNELLESFKKDKELVWLSEDLNNANHELRDDKEFVTKFIEGDPTSYHFASDRLKCDREVALLAVSLDGSMLEDVPVELRSYEHEMDGNTSVQNNIDEITNWKIVMTAVINDGYALRFAPVEWRNNFEIVKAAVRSDGLALKYASKEMQDCLEIVMIALEQNIHAIDYVSSRLQVSPQVINFTQSIVSDKNSIC
ncbi:hypothetical protein FDP41_006641 [Naegleria fowleri]|uniref:F-box domain-containing protein n=1 Tax=Naegleria fowleri TaxID=5763 RepID=A0A6A5BNX2_NAEFO|nr:uncharacterized protein FDP41_006641 [Naegleria fowleri]KAF0974609.1 hypothetical protein FDP41_006641 [Naegleria fowleri]CAG4719548.1 unnamed protein product [Naegleria fowleri]